MPSVLLAVSVILWAALHSWLAGNAVKDWVSSRLGAAVSRLYRFSYNVLAALTFLPVLLLMRALPDRSLYRVDAPWLLVMLAGQGIAALLGLVTLLQTDALHFAGIAQILGRRSGAGLEMGGFYRVVRHPLYLFGLIILWLTPFMTINVLTVYALLSAYLFVGAAFEEKRLASEYGAEYEQYRRRTPMIIPGLRLGRVKPSVNARS